MDKYPQVLIVDDSEDDTQLLLGELRKRGYEPHHERVDSALSMESALAGKKWDIVLSDCVLLNFSGISALEILKENGLDMPFILVSRKIDEETAVQHMRAGARDFFEKGNLWRLVPAIERELQNADERNRRKKAEELLRKSEERFRLITGTIDEVFWIVDVGIERMHYISPGYERVWGYSRLSLYKDPHSFIDAVHPEDRDRMLFNLKLQKKGQPYDHEYRIIRPDGEVRWIWDHGYPVRDETGHLTCYVGVAHDITLRKQAEEERKKLEEQLLQAQKMEAIGQLTGGIAHDFNNILTVITGFGAIMKMKLQDDDPLHMHIEHILAASDRAVNLTRSLLAFSRKQIMAPKPVDMNEIILKGEKFLRRVISELVELKVNTADETLIIYADSMQIEQVLVNLATNARDAMPNGGTMLVETSSFAIDDHFINTHGYGRKGSYAILSLSDTGTGMDKTTSERIFEPFFTTKEAGKGTGLGLSVVYGIIMQHNGFITCDSRPGRGTTFRIYLPIIGEEPEKCKSLPDIPAQGGTETVLLAEDDEESRIASRMFLENYGYRVVEATNGAEAVALCRTHKDEIRLALIDVIMPRMNGWEAYSLIEQIKPGIKVIFISGYTADFVLLQQEMVRKGVNILSKPALNMGLLTKIRNLLDGQEKL
jgi:PAS domain S-box-containing protein